MTEDKMIETIIEHDQALKSVAKSITALTEETKASNQKLDSIVVSMSKQELILEKISSIEARTKDSFSRVHARIDEVSKTQTVGCTPLQLSTQSIKNNESRLEDIENALTWIVRVIVGAFVSGLIATLFILARK